MSPAIEYFLRNDRALNFLSFPCSLFLENKEQRLILVINDYKETLIVKRYNPYEITKKETLPFPTRSVVLAKEIFSNSFVIIPEFKLFDFVEDPYVNRGLQRAEIPHSALQEKEYNDKL